MSKFPPAEYNGTITAEQFLFYEIRIASKFYLDGVSLEDATSEIKSNNLFQYPTERLVSRMVKSCYKRLDALDNASLREELGARAGRYCQADQPVRHDALQPGVVWDFMVHVTAINSASRTSTSRRRTSTCSSPTCGAGRHGCRMDGQDHRQNKQVLKKLLIEVEILDTPRSTRLNPLFLCEELEQGIRENNDTQALAAFNCFR